MINTDKPMTMAKCLRRFMHDRKILFEYKKLYAESCMLNMNPKNIIGTISSLINEYPHIEAMLLETLRVAIVKDTNLTHKYLSVSNEIGRV